MPFNFDNSYARLPEQFFSCVAPTGVGAPKLVAFNEKLAWQLGLDSSYFKSKSGLDILSGNALPQGANALAMAYAGHQFGGFVPKLGDGRAVLLGEHIGLDGRRVDVQLKGAGKTPYSRGGDGRAWLGPVLREYLVSENLHALGVPTTRALAAVVSGENVLREQVLPGAILTRIASSHIRIGTFQYFAARDDLETIKLLTHYTISRHYVDVAASENPVLNFLKEVIARQIKLIAQWMGLGFIHGVMNTDNMSICGETIDFGPCAFMDEFKKDKVFSSIDVHGRYAWHQQPMIAKWNLAQLANCLLPLIDRNEKRALELAQEVIDGYDDLYEDAFAKVFSAKLGLLSVQEGDDRLIADLLDLMDDSEVDFTLFFSVLGKDGESENIDLGFKDEQKFLHWLQRWQARVEQDDLRKSKLIMAKANPLIIARNHQVEAVIQSALRDDYKPFEVLFEAVTHPYDGRRKNSPLRWPPKPENRITATFCGT